MNITFMAVKVKFILILQGTGHFCPIPITTQRGTLTEACWVYSLSFQYNFFNAVSTSYNMDFKQSIFLSNNTQMTALFNIDSKIRIFIASIDYPSVGSGVGCTCACRIISKYLLSTILN